MLLGKKQQIKVVDDKSQCGMQALDSAISAINIAIEVII